MYRHSKVNRICTKARQIVKDLFGFFMREPNCMPSAWFEQVQGGEDKIAASAHGGRLYCGHDRPLRRAGAPTPVFHRDDDLRISMPLSDAQQLKIVRTALRQHGPSHMRSALKTPKDIDTFIKATLLVIPSVHAEWKVTAWSTISRMAARHQYPLILKMRMLAVYMNAFLEAPVRKNWGAMALDLDKYCLVRSFYIRNSRYFCSPAGLNTG